MAPKACGERQEIYHTVGGTYAEALVTMCDGGNAPAAAFYEAQLPRARALFDRLSSR